MQEESDNEALLRMDVNFKKEKRKIARVRNDSFHGSLGAVAASSVDA
jgi:hypothetical protein